MTIEPSPAQPPPSPKVHRSRRARTGRAGAALTGLATVVALWFGLAAPSVSPVAAPSLSTTQVVQAPAAAVPVVQPSSTTTAQDVSGDGDGDRELRGRNNGRDGNPGGRR